MIILLNDIQHFCPWLKNNHTDKYLNDQIANKENNFINYSNLFILDSQKINSFMNNSKKAKPEKKNDEKNYTGSYIDIEIVDNSMKKQNLNTINPESIPNKFKSLVNNKKSTLQSKLSEKTLSSFLNKNSIVSPQNNFVTT